MPEPDVIIKYPTPENAHNLTFRDDADNCYKFNISLYKLIKIIYNKKS